MDDIRKGNCPLCSHNEILEGLPLGQTHFVEEIMSQVPLAVVSWLGKAFGALNSYTCRKCGFTQFFADDPAKIPVGQKFRTRVIGSAEGSGPYR